MSVEQIPAEERFHIHPSVVIGTDVLAFSEAVVDEMMAIDRSSRESEKVLGGKLKSARSQLRELDGKQRQQFLNTLLSEEASPFIRTIVQTGMDAMEQDTTGLLSRDPKLVAERTLIEALTRQGANKRYTVPNRSFMNVLEYYKAKHPDPEDYDTPTTLAYKDVFEQRVVELVHTGIFPQSAIGKLMEVQLAWIGSVESLKALGTMGHEGVKIRTSVIGTKDEAPVVMHELTHALRFDMDFDPNNPNHSVDRETYRIFNEGTTELITELLMQDEYDHDDNTAYVDERNVIIALCELSDGQLTAKDFIDVFCDAEYGQKNVPWLLNKIATIYSPQMLKRLKASGGWSKNAQGMTKLQSIATDLYLERASNVDGTTDQADYLTDRLYDVSSGRLCRRNFLLDDATVNHTKGRA